MPTLETKHITKNFEGVRATDDVSISFKPSKITGIIGPNGSGKSTLVNLLTGLIPKDKGYMILSDDVKIENIRPYDMKTYSITRTFQDSRLFEQMTVMENIMVVLTKRNVWSALFEKKSKLYEDRAKDILDEVGLWFKKDELAHNLSYGQRKLLEIARVLAMDPDIIFFDEPYSGLFPEMVKKISGIIQRLKKEDKTVVLIEHNMDLIRELCDHVYVLDAGKLLAEGKPSKVLEQKNVIEAYLGD